MALVPQRRYLPGRHPLFEGEPEVRWSHHRSWSNVSGRDRPGSQNSYPHTSLELLQRPPYTCESWCLMPRLPQWQDMTAEQLAPGLLNAVLSLSSHPQARLLVSAVYRSFLQKVDIRRPEWVGQARILLAEGRVNCPQGQPCSSSVAC